MRGLFAGVWFAGRSVCMCALTLRWFMPGSVGARGGVVSLQGRLQALSAVLTPGLYGRDLRPGSRGTWDQTVQQKEPRKGLGGAFLAQLRASRGVGKSSPTAGLAHKSGRHSRQESFPGPQLHHHGPAAYSISTLTSVLSRDRKPSRAQLPPSVRCAPELPRSGLDLWPV